MTRNNAHVAFLFLSGLLAAAIGAGVTFTPVAFAASNGIELAADPNLLSEVRAPGGALLAFGLLMLAGAFRRELRFSASLAAAAVYLPYGLARGVGILADGLPADGLLVATGVELAVGGLALLATRHAWRENKAGASSRPVPALARA